MNPFLLSSYRGWSNFLIRRLLSSEVHKVRYQNVGIAAHTGRRIQNEDRYHVCEVDGGKYLYCGLFDGAGGTDAAEFASKELHRIFENETDISQSEENRLSDAIQKADKLFSSNPISYNCGTTATIALVSEKDIIIGNVGDTRGLLCQNGLAEQISKDHRPSIPSERKRLEDAGATLTDDPFGASRLMGILNFSRAIGFNLFKQYGLDNHASVDRVQLNDEHKFLILGTDGVFDVLSRQELVELGEDMPSAQSVADRIISTVAGIGVKDNATVIVVGLPIDNPNFGRTSKVNHTNFSQTLATLNLTKVFGRKLEVIPELVPLLNDPNPCRDKIITTLFLMFLNNDNVTEKSDTSNQRASIQGILDGMNSLGVQDLSYDEIRTILTVISDKPDSLSLKEFQQYLG